MSVQLCGCAVHTHLPHITQRGQLLTCLHSTRRRTMLPSPPTLLPRQGTRQVALVHQQSRWLSLRRQLSWQLWSLSLQWWVRDEMVKAEICMHSCVRGEQRERGVCVCVCVSVCECVCVCVCVCVRVCVLVK
jgi:hypothetical protein